MKGWFNRLLCRIFGHRVYQEVYARSCAEIQATSGCRHRRRYYVIRHRYCGRCGMTEHEVISAPMRRTEMLSQGWFIEEGPTEEPSAN